LLTDISKSAGRENLYNDFDGIAACLKNSEKTLIIPGSFFDFFPPPCITKYVVRNDANSVKNNWEKHWFQNLFPLPSHRSVAFFRGEVCCVNRPFIGSCPGRSAANPASRTFFTDTNLDLRLAVSLFFEKTGSLLMRSSQVRVRYSLRIRFPIG
jgi:hypothetical protein